MTETAKMSSFNPVIQSQMDFIMKNAGFAIPKANDLVEGIVLEKKGRNVFVEISSFGTGIIYGREFNNARDIIKVLKPGDKIIVKIVELENEMGYISLSLKEAKQEIVWRDAEEIKNNKTVIKLKVVDANKGGLILDWKGLQGFLPTSQLKVGHYPRIEDGDRDKILEELKKLVGQEIEITMISLNPKEGKLIFSEKSTETEEIKERISKYKVGDIIDGKVTGVVEFGIFIEIENGLEGLIHISELDWGLVENPADLFEVGQKVKAQIISIKDDKISLSIKALKINPWEEAEKKYHKGDIINGVVIRFNKHGALISVEEGIFGLVHISEFESENDMKQKIELGKSYPFQITFFEPKEQKLILSYLEKPKD
ncbi:S1 RNA-binding domain-containing protein [Patescibacteria group bacterium]|nr:S1 RNA-binding domain-containing protein [Patescibacteria group bacterium]MBU2263652.1 S1 RNA-binding domain-containing protein [Patescibacteria group bacterium]